MRGEAGAAAQAACSPAYRPFTASVQHGPGRSGRPEDLGRGWFCPSRVSHPPAPPL
ncbi:hypothetical protein STRTUCAR8_04854, partial [Streptomyces turgidiscabies Car8]